MAKRLITRRNALGALGVGAAAVLAGCTSSDDSSSGSSAGSATTSTSTSTTTLSGSLVDTAYGPVQGVEEDAVICWYGIPYGKSPEGDLRWQAPEAPDTWEDALDCTTTAEQALQVSDDEVVGTEDCLTLDVVSAEGYGGKPVLVFVHGGNNQTGSSNDIAGNDMVVNDDCVYVSLNYRLGLLGFNCLPAIRTQSDTGNFAMLDIAFALDWVKDNIEQFGGDPGNITVSGFSAGGRDVMAMLASPYFEGKFQKAIAYSGGMTTCSESVAAREIAEAIAPLAVEDGMAEDEDTATDWLLGEDSEVLDYLYSIDSSRLVSLMTNANIRMAAFPHLYEDGVVVPETGFDGAEYNSVPLIMLTGATEFSFFCLYDSWWSSDEAAEYSDEEITAAKTFVNLNGSNMYRIFNAQESADAMLGLYDADMYVCQINYGSVDSPMSEDLGDVGAYHGIFVPMISPTENSYADLADFTKAGYTDMATQYNSYLKNFLSTGDPNGDDLVTWEPWDHDNRVSLVMDADEDAATVELEDVTASYGDIIEDMQVDDTIPDDLKELAATNVINGRWFSAEVDEYYSGNWNL